MAKDKAFKITIQGPEGKEVIQADNYLLATLNKGGRSNLTVANSTFAGLNPQDADDVGVISVIAMAEQIDKDVPNILEQLGVECDCEDLEDGEPAGERSEEEAA